VNLSCAKPSAKRFLIITKYKPTLPQKLLLPVALLKP